MVVDESEEHFAFNLMKMMTWISKRAPLTSAKPITKVYDEPLCRIR